ncbi:hypothetical protein GF340_00520 [Candidatus Peregrinibacteria bacterium]|nr:hypothetical protein [Candidatus Peregrinibacteria bacterium]
MKKIVAFLILIFILSACQNTDNSTNNRLCDNIPAEQIKSLLESGFESKPFELEDNNTDSCIFTATNGDDRNKKNISIIIRTYNNLELLNQDYQKAIATWDVPQAENREKEIIKELSSRDSETFWTYGSAITNMISKQNNTLTIITTGHLPFEKKELKKHLIILLHNSLSIPNQT